MIHSQAFTLSGTVLSVGIVGHSGLVGSQLVKQILSQRESLRALGADVRIVAAGDVTGLAVNDRGLGEDVAAAVAGGSKFSLDALTEALERDINPLRAIVDCTASDEVTHPRSPHLRGWPPRMCSLSTPTRLATPCVLALHT